MNTNFVLSAKSIYKSYGHLQILKGINLDIRQAEIVSIVGKSGAGKSTLLHILGTLSRMDDGELIIDGQKIAQMSDNALASFRNQNIGFVFQFHHLLQEFTALENVCIPALIGGVPKNLASSRAKELLNLLGLEKRLEHKPSALSGGEQQRIAVARALINRPKIIFADEPTGNLDSKNSEELYELFFKLRDNFKNSFIIVTHNEHFASLSDRILKMEDGKIITHE